MALVGQQESPDGGLLFALFYHVVVAHELSFPSLADASPGNVIQGWPGSIPGPLVLPGIL
jgi:hypothetical protein